MQQGERAASRQLLTNGAWQGTWHALRQRASFRPCLMSSSLETTVKEPLPVMSWPAQFLRILLTSAFGRRCSFVSAMMSRGRCERLLRTAMDLFLKPTFGMPCEHLVCGRATRRPESEEQ